MSTPASSLSSAEEQSGQVEILNVFAGKAFGLRQPTYLARCRIASAAAVDWVAIDALMARWHSADGETSGELETALLCRVGTWVTQVQMSAGLPVFEKPLVLDCQREDSQIVGVLAVPYPPGRPRVAIAALRWAVRCAALLVARDPTAEAVISGSIEPLLEKLRAAAPKNSNSLYYLKAAHERGTPWDLMTRDVYQFGWGAKSRLMRGSFTDASGTIGARLARDKHASAEVLRRIGLPAPEHAIVTSADHAEQVAAQIGYPVVVKPADRDGGVGVAAGLHRPDQVSAAYAAANRHSKRILVEKHASGQDYRMTIFNGQLIWTMLRQPGGVAGDGARTISQLVDAANADPRRGEQRRSPLKRLVLDDEATQLLAEQGMSLESIPAPKLFVRLRRAANVSTGGIPFAVNDKVHPDNRQLAVDVAYALRLDFAGIDILIEDISRSWHDVGAVICEVNADPQLGFTTQQHLYDDIIGALCGGRGRIPGVVIIGVERAPAIADIIGTAFAGKGVRIGVAKGQQVQVVGRVVSGRATNVFTATKALLAHPRVDVALVVIEDDAVLATSLPFDCIDAVLVAGEPHSNERSPLSRLLRMLAPNSSTVIFDQDVPGCQAAVASLPRPNVQAVSGGNDAIASAACVLIEAALSFCGSSISDLRDSGEGVRAYRDP